MKKLYHLSMSLYYDYRHVIPSYASGALSFYMLLLIIPATSLFAVGASLFDVDISLLEKLMEQYIKIDYIDSILEILRTDSIDTVAFITFLFSLYTVSRGIGNIYEISKNMYKESSNDSIITYYLYTLRLTLYLLFIFISFVSVLAIKPLSILFDLLYEIVGIRHILLYFILVVCLMTIYKLVPKVKIDYRDAFIGAFISGALMLLLYYGLQIYFLYVDFKTVYGPLASIVAVLFVFNWGAELFYVGMYVTHLCYVRRRKNERENTN